jgi:N-acetyl-anhydromuramyl-L-alanine amidase AmpD
MLITKDAEFLDSINHNIVKRKTKKTQILLFDTFRRTDEYILKLVHRRNGKYTNIPHFIVTKLGVVHNIFNTDFYSETFGHKEIDKKIIKIAIENLGWLSKNTITGVLYNWIGDPYRAEPYIKNWRNYNFWDKYTESQLNAVAELCNDLCDKHNIPKQSVLSQGIYNNADKIDGIVCKSNFSDIYTDINPSFDFNIFLKHAKE